MKVNMENQEQNVIIYNTLDGKAKVTLMAKDGNVWMNQDQIAELFSVVRKQDIYIAKNYLTHDEIDSLNRLTVLFLDSAELRVKERRDLTLDLIGYVKFSSPVAQAPNARLGHIYET